MIRYLSTAPIAYAVSQYHTAPPAIRYRSTVHRHHTPYLSTTQQHTTYAIAVPYTDTIRRISQYHTFPIPYAAILVPHDTYHALSPYRTPPSHTLCQYRTANRRKR
eukprot:1141553-Rhodomonas_salina.1